MGRFILKLDGKYLVWSSVVDAPISFGMTREELVEWWRAEHGRYGVGELLAIGSIERADASGCSAFGPATLDRIISHNRAGPEGSALTRDEIVERYVRSQKGPDP